jgi:hypothetical protein
MKAPLSIMGWGAVALLITLGNQQAQAALPPTPGLGPAPEVVDVEVLRVIKIWRPFASNLHKVGYQVWVIAKVKEVERTRTDIKRGSRIMLRYDADDCSSFWCGPGSYPIPSKGDSYRAHLCDDGWFYAPWGTPSDAPFIQAREK